MTLREKALAALAEEERPLREDMALVRRNAAAAKAAAERAQEKLDWALLQDSPLAEWFDTAGSVDGFTISREQPGPGRVLEYLEGTPGQATLVLWFMLTRISSNGGVVVSVGHVEWGDLGGARPGNRRVWVGKSVWSAADVGRAIEEYDRVQRSIPSHLP